MLMIGQSIQSKPRQIWFGLASTLREGVKKKNVKVWSLTIQGGGSPPEPNSYSVFLLILKPYCTALYNLNLDNNFSFLPLKFTDCVYFNVKGTLDLRFTNSKIS